MDIYSFIYLSKVQCYLSTFSKFSVVCIILHILYRICTLNGLYIAYRKSPCILSETQFDHVLVDLLLHMFTIGSQKAIQTSAETLALL